MPRIGTRVRVRIAHGRQDYCTKDVDPDSGGEAQPKWVQSVQGRAHLTKGSYNYMRVASIGPEPIPIPNPNPNPHPCTMIHVALQASTSSTYSMTATATRALVPRAPGKVRVRLR